MDKRSESYIKSDDVKNENVDLLKKLAYKDFMIKSLERQSATLSSEINKVYNSYSYKIFYNFLMHLFPHGSLRRKIAKIFFTTLKKCRDIFIDLYKRIFSRLNEDSKAPSHDDEEYKKKEACFFKRGNSSSVIVLDRYVPRYDNDAGSRSTFQYIKLLVDAGYEVKFMGADFLEGRPYSKTLEDYGVEILHGQYYALHWKDWFTEHKDEIDFIFLNRPDVAEIFLDFMKEVGGATFIYSCLDLHFLRVRREYEILKKKELLHDSERWKCRELSVMTKSDRILTMSSYEKSIIDKELGEDKTECIPIFYYKQYNEYIADFYKRDIMFVGSFAHLPNEDGILWFVREVWEKLSAALPGCKLFIVGSNTTDKINALSSSSIIVTGYVSDEELTEYYRYCKIAIMPLRYGAGVKGKVIEAMYNCIGVVSTSVGLEGLQDIQDYILPSDTPKDFFDEMLSLYNDDEKLKVNINKCGNYIKRYFSYERALNIIKEVFK